MLGIREAKHGNCAAVDCLSKGLDPPGGTIVK